MNKKSILLTHPMKTAYSLNFERMGAITLIWDRRTWHWVWNKSAVADTKLTIAKKKKGAQGRVESGWGRDGGGRRSSSSRYTCEQNFALNFFATLNCTSTISKLTTLIVFPQILHFQQLQGSHLWWQGSFALRGIRLRKISWWNYASDFVRTFFHKENENA